MKMEEHHVRPLALRDNHPEVHYNLIKCTGVCMDIWIMVDMTCTVSTLLCFSNDRFLSSFGFT